MNDKEYNIEKVVGSAIAGVVFKGTQHLSTCFGRKPSHYSKRQAVFASHIVN
jgi:hypothetical protein